MSSTFDYFYRGYGDVEDEFLAELDKSLQPRGPDTLYDLVAELRLAAHSRILDVGCGDGTCAVELARRFGYRVLGIDPYHPPRADAVATGVTLERGVAERLPVADASIDMIWCRDMLVHVEDLARVFAECRRVLRAGGYMLILHSLATDRFPAEPAERLWSTMHVVPENTERQYFEAAVAGAGLRVERSIDIGSEWREYREESTGQSRLLHVARLLRQPDRYIERFGQAAYEIMLGDCYWHIYQLLGYFSYHVYVLLRR